MFRGGHAEGGHEAEQEKGGIKQALPVANSRFCPEIGLSIFNHGINR